MMGTVHGSNRDGSMGETARADPRLGPSRRAGSVHRPLRPAPGRRAAHRRVPPQLPARQGCRGGRALGHGGLIEHRPLQPAPRPRSQRGDPRRRFRPASARPPAGCHRRRRPGDLRRRLATGPAPAAPTACAWTAGCWSPCSQCPGSCVWCPAPGRRLPGCRRAARQSSPSARWWCAAPPRWGCR